jgi:hypothetical protein
MNSDFDPGSTFPEAEEGAESEQEAEDDPEVDNAGTQTAAEEEDAGDASNRNETKPTTENEEDAWETPTAVDPLLLNTPGTDAEPEDPSARPSETVVSDNGTDTADPASENTPGTDAAPEDPSARPSEKVVSDHGTDTADPASQNAPGPDAEPEDPSERASETVVSDNGTDAADPASQNAPGTDAEPEEEASTRASETASGENGTDAGEAMGDRPQRIEEPPPQTEFYAEIEPETDSSQNLEGDDASHPVAEPFEMSALITEVTRAVHAPRAPRRSRRTFNRSSIPADELRRLFDRMMKTRECPPSDALLPLRDWVQREMVTVVERRSYDHGARLRAGEAMLDDFIHADHAEERRELRRKFAAEHCKTVKRQLKKREEVFQREVTDWHGRQNARYEELRRSHEAELEEFELQWSDSDYLMAFRKPSPNLLQLRTIEKRLAILKQFDRAAIVRREADKLERAEMRDAQERAVTAMRTEYSNMITKHKREMECFEGFTNRVHWKIEKHKHEHVDPLQRLIARLTGEATPAATQEKKKEKLVLGPAWPETSRPVPDVQSARIQPPGQALGIGGINIRQHIKVTKEEGRRLPAKKKKKKIEKF